MLHMGLSSLQFVELQAKCVEDATHASMIRQHHAAHLVLGRHVGTFLCESNLDRGGTPRNKVGKLPFANSLE